MILPFRLALVKPPADKNARQRSLDAVKRYRDATVALERRCAELGIKVPECVC